LDSGDHFELNRTAYYVLDELSRGVDEAMIVKHLAEEYGLEIESVRSDVDDVLRAAAEQGLVEKEG
jgi:hypothetical protein